MKIITNDIEKECWDLLSIYEDVEYIKEKLLKQNPKIKKDTLNKASNEISFYIKQAEELYKASNDSIITSPLTLFYSLNNLVKATYLLKYPTKGIKASHGLAMNNTDSSNYKLSELSVHINNSGTFNNLNELLGNNLPHNININLKDMFSVIPELASIYNLVYNEEPNVYLMTRNLDKSYEYKIILPNDNYEETSKKNFKLLENNKVHLTFGRNALGYGCHVYKTLATENIDNVLEHDIYGNIFLTLGVIIEDNAIKVEQLNVIYIIMYAFSMEVRYRSYEWIDIINSKEKAIVKKSIDELKVKMLIYILKLIENNNFEFINKVDNYKEDIDYSELTEKILKEIKWQNRRSGHSVLRDLI